jgi:glutathione S-transferase
MQLYFAETLNGRKACAAAHYLNSPVTFIRLDLRRQEQRKPEFLALNPNGKIPLLRDGQLSLWESNAIMCHLSDHAGSDFWPHDARQGEVLRWLFWDANHFGRHAARLYFQNVIKPAALGAEPDPAETQEATGFFRQFAAILDAHLKDRDFVVGKKPTVADFALGATLPYAEAAQIPAQEFSALVRWHDRLKELPAWAEPYPREAVRPQFAAA